MHYVRFTSEEEKSRYVAAYEELSGEEAAAQRTVILKQKRSAKAGPEIVTRVHAKNLVRWAADKPKVLVLSADLTSSTEIDLFRDTYPDRFLSMGIAEQNMLSFAGGPGAGRLHPLCAYLRGLHLPPRLRPDRHVRGLSQPAGQDDRLPAGHHHAGRRDPSGHRGHRGHARASEHDGAGVRGRDRGGDRARRHREDQRPGLCADAARRDPAAVRRSEPMELGKARVMSEGEGHHGPVQRHHDRGGDAGSAGAQERGPLGPAHAYLDA